MHKNRARAVAIRGEVLRHTREERLILLDLLIANLKELYAHLICETGVSDPKLTNCMSLISGPSTTRDIESLPVNGAHGSREGHILAVI